MPDHGEKPADLIDPPPRFSVWQGLVLMTAVAVLAGIAAPSVRAWEADQWWLFGVGFASQLGYAAVGFGIQEFITWRQRRRAGDNLMWVRQAGSKADVRNRSTTLSTSPVPLRLSVSVGILMALAYGHARSSEWDPNRGMQPTLYNYYFFGLAVGVASWYGFRRRSILGAALGSKGVFVASELKCYPWEIITAPGLDQWNEGEELSLRIGGNFPKRVTLLVAPDMRPQVEALLAECLPER